MTAAVFEAEFVPCAENEVSKTKLHFNLSPAAGINLVLAPVRVHRYLILDSDKSPPIVFLDASGSTFTKRGRVGQSVSVKMYKKIFKVDFSISPSPNRKKNSRFARFSCLWWGAGFVRVAGGTEIYLKICPMFFESNKTYILYLIL